MRVSTIVLASAAAAAFAGCGEGGNQGAGSQANEAANAAAATKPRPSYCFFKESETRNWKVRTDRSGNVLVSGEAYRSDPRYKAILGPATVSGASAELSPTIVVNDTGFASPGNWWPLSAAIPNSQSVTRVTVTCGGRTVANLEVQRKK